MRRRGRFLLGIVAVLLPLVMAGCGASDAPGGDRAGEPAPTTPPGEPAAVTGDVTWYDEHELVAAQAEAAPDTVWLAGWFAPEALEDPGVADMEARYFGAAGLTPDATPEQRARAAFAALEGPGPVDLLNPLEGVSLQLRSARLDDGGAPTAVLDFGAGLTATNQLGSAGAAAAEAQFHAMVAEYFPEAANVGVTVEGAGSALFHGKPYDGPVALLR